MFDLPKQKLVSKVLRIHNPHEHSLTVCLEPWTERLSLTSNGTMELVFVGPDIDNPEIIPDSDETTVYGWEGSEVVALQNGRLLGHQPTVEEIVRQELGDAKDKIKRTRESLAVEQIVWIQQGLDNEPELNRRTQEFACELAAILAVDLASSVVRSPAATGVLWQIISRLIGTKGLLLGAADSPSTEEVVWNESPGPLIAAIRDQAISVLPGVSLSPAVERRVSTTQRRVESEFDPNRS